MIVAGLTGSIAMGKSETAKMFAARGIPVFDSDAAVHALYAKGGEAVSAIAAIAPEAISEGTVNRSRLAQLVQQDPGLLPKVEAAVHPLVKARQQSFLAEASARAPTLPFSISRCSSKRGVRGMSMWCWWCPLEPRSSVSGR